MKFCILDGENITDKEKLHDILAVSLGFPDWYGMNLDALYDCLTDIREETEIEIRGIPALEANLGRTARGLLKVLRDAAEENTALHLKADWGQEGEAFRRNPGNSV